MGESNFHEVNEHDGSTLRCNNISEYSRFNGWIDCQIDSRPSRPLCIFLMDDAHFWLMTSHGFRI